MKNKLFIILIGLLFSQCQESEKNIQKDKHSLISINQIVDNKIDSVQTDEIIIDSINIGSLGRTKIDIRQIRNLKEGIVFVHFKIYKKETVKWKLTQEFNIEKDGITGLDLVLSDFNNDGFNDLTFKSGVAARGANELRNLFIYDSLNDSLIFIKNSNIYPNLEYNKELDCLDAWLFYAGSSTVFLKLETDSLREFAGVSLLDTREVYTIEKNGDRKILSNEIIKDSALYVRYSNYNPLKRKSIND